MTGRQARTLHAKAVRKNSGIARRSQLSRVYRSCAIEPLEPRTLMSAAASASESRGTPVHYSPPRRDLHLDKGFLTVPRAGAALQIAREYLQTQAVNLGVTAEDLRHLAVTDQYTDDASGLTHIYFRQEYHGLPIANTNLGVHLMSDGRILAVNGNLVGGLDYTGRPDVAPGLDAVGGLEFAGAHLGIALQRGGTQVKADLHSFQRQQVLANRVGSPSDIPTQLEFEASSEGVRLAWRYGIQMPDSPDYFSMSVDATTGEVLEQFNMTSYITADHTYKVYQRPSKGPDPGSTQDLRTFVRNPEDLVASPQRWHDNENYTRGNNALVGSDISGTNDPQGIDLVGWRYQHENGSLYYDYLLDLTTQPDNPTYANGNRQSAMVNMFYWLNTCHDIFYRYGFTEAAGNFQEVNYSGAGVGGDRVQGHVWDTPNSYGFGASTWPPEPAPPGSSPARIELPVNIDDLRGPPTTERDVALDSMIIIHEYAHGMTRRLVGGPGNMSGLSLYQSAEIGEGFSDWFALMLTQKDSDLRNAGYYFAPWIFGHTYNYTYGDPSFFDGLDNYRGLGRWLWGQTLFDMYWEIKDRNPVTTQNVAAGYAGASSNPINMTMQIVMTSLTLLPQNPTELEARDAILLADGALTGGRNHAAIWAAFADHGMGINASVTLDANHKIASAVTDYTVQPIDATIDTIGLYDPATSVFYLRNSLSTGVGDTAFGFGAAGAGWLPIAGDWNGNNRDTIGLYDPQYGQFYLRNTNSTGLADVVFGFGPAPSTWLPIAGDWNGDGTETIGLYDNVAHRFYLRNSNTTGMADVTFLMGGAGTTYVPLGGDWDGYRTDRFAKGTDSGGLFVSGTFLLRNALSDGGADYAFGLGDTGWKPVTGDWTARGRDTGGSYNPGASIFYLRTAYTSGNGSIAIPFGAAGAGWLPIAGDWDGPTGAALLAEGPAIANPPPNETLTQESLSPLVTAAIAQWAAAGLAPAWTRLMQRVEFVIASLPDRYLALTTPGMIRIDADAAGYGWFMDLNPQRNEEFTLAAGQLLAVDARAAGHMDLLTTIAHELGHAVGLPDLDAALHDLMSGTLTPGVRRTVALDDVLVTQDIARG